MEKTIVRMFAALMLSLLVVSFAVAQQPPTKNLYVNLVTRTQAMPKIPGLPAGIKIPGMGGGATRMITGRAVYAVGPVAPIYLTVPADLGLANNRLVLNVPKPGVDGADGETADGGGTGGSVEMTNKVYWHPDEAKGPITDNVKMSMGNRRGMGGMQMPNLDQSLLAELGKEANGSEMKLPANVKGQGNYVCNTGGTATLDGFLPPLDVTEPALEKVNPNAGFTLKWSPVPGARGYLIAIMAMKNQGDDNHTKMNMTSWYSTLGEPPMRVRGAYTPATTIADDLKDGILLPGDTTSCKVPAGMFGDGYDMLVVKAEAIGNDFYSPASPTVYGVIRSEWSAMKMNMGEGDVDE